MTFRQLMALLIIACLTALAATFLTRQARAVEPNDPNCYSQAELERDNIEAGGIIAGAAYYDGVRSDTVIFIQGKREILAILFKDGCFVGIEGVDLTAVSKGNPA